MSNNFYTFIWAKWSNVIFLLYIVRFCSGTRRRIIDFKVCNISVGKVSIISLVQMKRHEDNKILNLFFKNYKWVLQHISGERGNDNDG